MTVALNGLDLALGTPKSVTYIMDKSQALLLSFYNDFSSRSFILSLCFYFVYHFVFCFFNLSPPPPSPAPSQRILFLQVAECVFP